MSDSRNTIVAVILSALVLIAWQYFYNIPQMEKQRLAEQTRKELSKPTQPANNTATPQDGAASAPRADAPAAAQPASAAPQDRHPAHHWQYFPERRAHRRSVAGAVPRNRRSDVARDRSVFALRHGRALLRRVRLGSR